MASRDFNPAAQRLAAVVESSDDAIVSKDLNGIVVTWNPAAERMFGYTSAEIVGRSIRMIIPADRQFEEDDVLARIRRGESVAHFETLRMRKDGSLIPISLTVSPVKNEAGDVIGASKIPRDISDRRQAEAALATAEGAKADLQRRLLALVAASRELLVSPSVADVLPAVVSLARQTVQADAYAVWRFSHEATAWRIESSAGLSPEFVTTTTPSADESTADEIISEPLVIEDVRSAPQLENRWPAYGGEGIRAMLAVPLILHAKRSGTLVFYYRQPHVFDDVDVQAAVALANLASAALTTAELYDVQRQSRRDSEFLAESGKALSSSLDFEQTLRHVAQLAVPYFADWCAVDLATPDGPSRLAVAHVDPGRVELAKRFAAQYPEDRSSTYSVSHVIRTGRPVLVEHLTDEMIVAGARSEEHLAAVRGLGITSFMVVPLGILDRVLGAMTFATAESGRRYNAVDLRVAQEVAYRAAFAIDSARQYDELQRVNRVKDDFLATLSHELRTPLNAILGYARMLRWGMLAGDRQQRAFEIIDRNVTSLAQIVDDVLDISRIVAGKLRLNLQPVDLALLITRSVETVQPAADAKGVRVHVALGAVADRIWADPDRLQQVLWNLLSNAVKFTPTGGRVDIRLTRTETEVDIEVRDTGMGVAPEFLPHMFERFRQADSRFTREYGGLGLGLAIARNLVEMHGGSIRAESPGLGRGSTFSIRIPARTNAGDDDSSNTIAHRSDDGAAAAAARIRLDGLHVLAVDDDADELMLLREVLESAGARVTTASSAQSALSALETATPDVLLTDIGMPGMDGFDLISRVRDSTRRYGAVPAAALTAYARSDDRARAFRSGFQLHLPKPIDPLDLLTAVRQLAKKP